jgi:hemolysin activation/secretion protein
MAGARGQDAGADPSFPIRAFEVSGNTLLDPAAVDARLRPFSGDQRRFADVEAARRALEGMYLQAGYSTVQVTLPDQEVSAGIIRLTVREMKIGRVEVVGAEFRDVDNIRRSLPQIREGTVPDTRALAESLRLANDNPAKQTTALLKPDPAAGEVNALLRVEDEKPWKAFVTFDNTGNDETGNNRLGVGFQHANLFNRDHVATIQFITSPEQWSDVRIFGAGYRIPVYEFPGAFDFYAGYSDVDSGTVAGLFKVSGKGTIAGGRYTHYLAKTSAFENKVAAGIDYRAYRNDVDFSGAPLGNDVTVHPLNLTWSGLYRVEGTQAGAYASWLVNIPGGSNGDDAAFAAARAGADANYRLLRAGASMSRQLPGDWQFRLAADGQYSGDALVPGEQFGLGGMDSVRGFNERVISNDRGWRASVELYTPDLGSLTRLDNARLRLLAFVDGGHLNRNDPLPGEVASEGIASTGVGVRFGIGKSVSFRLDYGYVLEGYGTVTSSHDKLHGSIAYVY